MKITQPKLEHRNEQPYAGIRTQARSQEFPIIIPQLLDEIFGWLGEQGIEPDGAPFMRYHVINMEAKMDVELGVPVATTLSGNGRILGGSLPSGQYASLVYTDVTKGIEGNRALIEWANEQGIAWDAWDAEDGHAFRSRVEFFLSGPADDPDPTKWDTEVAIMIADK